MNSFRILVFVLFCNVAFSQEKYEVFFDFNKDFPNATSLTSLQKWMEKQSRIEVLKVNGYCDSVDNKSYNKDLAERRIQSVLKILKEGKIAISAKVDLQAFGKNFKLSANQDENRKVTIFYKSTQFVRNSPPFDQELPNEGNIPLKIENEKKGLKAKFDLAKKGDIITIQNIYFYLDSEKIVEKSKPILEELYLIMKNNPKLKIQVQGHICCNTKLGEIKLSKQRALAICAFLKEREILFNRLSSVGFGNTKPVFKIPEQNEEERLANRRVEILIVDK